LLYDAPFSHNTFCIDRRQTDRGQTQHGNISATVSTGG